MESVENRIRKAPNKSTTDRAGAHLPSLWIFNDTVATALGLGQESHAKTSALEIVIARCVVELPFG
jgi:hypothetical protein